MLVGSDNFGIQVTGFSFHKEMQHLQNAGVPTYDIRRAATVISARFLGRSASAGTINVGKNAEFVILDKNPLTDIKNTQTIAGVMLKGQWFDRSQLDEMLQKVEDTNKK
jgi:imidazolonepropionase-like amidohydrolase